MGDNIPGFVPHEVQGQENWHAGNVIMKNKVNNKDGLTAAAVFHLHGTAFRILQVTDIHGDVSESDNEHTRADITAMVRRFEPDLIAVTGDVWCSDDSPETAPMWMARELRFFGSLGVPWTFIPGNHDHIGDWESVHARIAETPQAVAPQGNGRGAFRVELLAGLGEMPRAAWDLFFLNSGGSWQIPEDLDWFVAESERLAQVRGRVVPALVFFHIPLGNCQKAVDEGRARGIMLEEARGWGDDDLRGTEMVKRCRNVRACFCGHFHRNNYCFEEDGILFVCGRATGYGGYGHDTTPKGGTLIELGGHSETVSFKTVFADGSTWTPREQE